MVIDIKVGTSISNSCLSLSFKDSGYLYNVACYSENKGFISDWFIGVYLLLRLSMKVCVIYLFKSEAAGLVILK